MSQAEIEGFPHGYAFTLSRSLLRLSCVCAWPERIVLAPWTMRIPIDRPIFITGAYRSGTTVLEQTLAQHPHTGFFWYFTNAAYRTPAAAYALLCLLTRMGMVDGRRQPYLHNPRLEFTPFSAYESEWVWAQAGRSLWEPACHDMSMDAGFTNPTFERSLRSSIRRHLLVRRARRFVNKNPVHLLRLPYLHRLFPDARFIYILREPQATILSHYRIVQRIAQVIHPCPRARQAFEQGLHLDVLTPRIKTARYAETLALDRIHPLLGIAHQWRTMHETALAGLEANRALDRQTLRITYEALTRDPAAVLDLVWRFVGLEGPDADAITATASQHLTPPPAAVPTPEEARWLPAAAEIVAPVAVQLGYGPSPH